MPRPLSQSKASEDKLEIIRRVSKASKTLLDDAVVTVFGGVAFGDVTGARDIDILLVARTLPKTARGRAKLKEALEKEARLPPINPIEIHLATPEEGKMNPIYREILKQHSLLE